jgi:hypothetical protein
MGSLFGGLLGQHAPGLYLRLAKEVILTTVLVNGWLFVI